MLIQWFKDHIDKEFPEFQSDDLFIAVSGGLDSMVLSELMNQLRYHFTILHCNFKLRPEAEEEARFIEEWANQNGQKFQTTSFDTEQYAKNQQISIQMAARELRYDWFESTTANSSQKSILLAHHQDDLVETFFINLTRGSGIHGMKSIPKKRGNYKRPLLAFSKSDILKFAEDNKVQWKEDASNQKNDYLRNHIRNNVIPKLQEKVPHISPQIASSVNYLKDVAEYMDSETEQFLQDISSIEKDRRIISLDKISPKQKTLLNHALLKYGFKNSLSEQILNALNTSGKQFLSSTHICVTDRNRLIIYPIGIQETKNATIHTPTSTGEYRFNHHRFNFTSSETPNWQAIKQTPSSIALFDLDKLTQELEIRYWQQGDSMNILGMKGRKLLSDIFIDEKISLDQKNQIPIILSDNEIIWCCGIRQSNHACITESTKQVLKIEIID